jgi:hypothetical protein
MFTRSRLAATTFVAFSSLATAGTIAVAPGQSIQAAIQAAQDGDRIELAPGHYAEAIDFLGKGITVIGTGGANATTIDAAGLGQPVVTFDQQEGPDSVLEGVTLTGAVSPVAGGGIRSSGGSNPTIRRCRIVANTAPRGAGVALVDSSAVIEHCRIESNVGTQIGGSPASAPGGGILVHGGFLTLRDSILRANSGGGLVAILGSTIDVRSCRFEDHAGLPALAMENAEFILRDCDFLRNEARALWVAKYAHAAVERCRFIANGVADAFGGGAVLAYVGADPGGLSIRIESCVFARNHAFTGSAVRLTLNTEGGDPPPGGLTIESSTFVANGPGATIHSETLGTPWDAGLVLHGSIVRGTAPLHAGPSDPLLVTYCNVEGGFPGAGNFDADPLFVDPAADDYHLRVGSPCIAAGDPAGPFPLDLDGNARLAGLANDVGADEFAPTLDVTGDGAAGAIARFAIYGAPPPAPVPSLLFLSTALAGGSSAFQLALPVLPILLPPLDPGGFLAFTATVPAGLPSITVYAQAWTGSSLTTVASLDL